MTSVTSVTNAHPKWPELDELGHTHLERAVQPQGECPGCDRAIWEPQRARLNPSRPDPPGEACGAVYVWHPRARRHGDHQHVCGRAAGHGGVNHRCSRCGRVWKRDRGTT